MKSINIYLILFLWAVLLHSSCKKEQLEEDPYLSIFNLIPITTELSNVYYYEPVKMLSLEDGGYLMLTNLHLEDGSVNIQYSRFNSDRELIWSEIYSEFAYSNTGVDLVQVQDYFYIVANTEMNTGSRSRIKVLQLDQNGELLQESPIPASTPPYVSDPSHFYDYSATAIFYGKDAFDNYFILVTGFTTDVDDDKPGFEDNILYDTKDIITVRLDLSTNTFQHEWNSIYGFTRDDVGAAFIKLEDRIIVGGTTRNRERSPDYKHALLLLEYRQESGNIINIHQFNIPGIDLGWLDMVYDADRQQIYLFAYDMNAPATIYKITTDNDFNQLGDIDIVNLVHTEPITYRSINLLSNGLFLVTLEKTDNENTQNIEWVTFTINGAVQNRYAFNDPGLKYIESVGSLRNEKNKVLSEDRLVFPIAYQHQKRIGTYKIDLNSPIQN